MAAYSVIRPFGPGRDDYRAALICSTLANVLAGKKGKAFGPDDFIKVFSQADEKKRAERSKPRALLGQFQQIAVTNE